MFSRDTRNLRERRDTFALQMAMHPKKFGRNLKLARERMRLTQEAAAERLGVSQRALQRWESGEVFPRGYNVDRIAEGYGVEVADLLRDADDAGAPPVTIGDRLAALEAQGVRLEEKLDAVLALFTDAEALAAALDRRRSDEPPLSAEQVAGLGPDASVAADVVRGSARTRA